MSHPPIKVLAINGSARKGGNTSILLRYVLRELEMDGIETELIELAGMKSTPAFRAAGAPPEKTAAASKPTTWATS
jgi:multimeric flavodoxin WrbA